MLQSIQARNFRFNQFFFKEKLWWTNPYQGVLELIQRLEIGGRIRELKDNQNQMNQLSSPETHPTLPLAWYNFISINENRQQHHNCQCTIWGCQPFSIMSLKVMAFSIYHKYTNTTLFQPLRTQKNVPTVLDLSASHIKIQISDLVIF